MSVASRPIAPTRGFLTHSANPSKSYDAFGYVLLPKQPIDATLKQRYFAACQAFLGKSSTKPEAPDFDLGARLMPTFWLLAATPSDARCDDLILHYDYERAGAMLGEVEKFSVPGPVLVAWQKPGSALPSRELILDLSKCSNEDMQRALAIWLQDIARDPQLWQTRFDAAAIRRHLLVIIQKYGDEILSTAAL